MFDVRYWGMHTIHHHILRTPSSCIPVIGVLNVAKVAPQYVRHSITVTGGAAAIRPFPKWSALAPIVGVLSSLVRALALDIAPIRVNLVVPGVIDTEIWDVSALLQPCDTEGADAFL
jgi:NAD(P)-dependent dehydrogenase (short-subunit alcohol dehydrogenase family)